MPVSLKVFLTALAIIDDLGAVLIIAVFYTSGLSLPDLGGAALALAALWGLNRAGAVRLWPYLLLGAALWVLVLRSGVHPTLAGVALAFAIPLRGAAGAPLLRLEHACIPGSCSPWCPCSASPITRVQIHLGDENAGKSGAADKRCVMEARPAGRQPVAVTHKAATLEEACDGAAEKLGNLLESKFGRLDDRKGAASIRDNDRR